MESSVDFFKVFLFLRYKSLPIFINIVLLSFWLPLLFSYFYRKDKTFLYLAIGFLFLFIKEFLLFLGTRGIFFDLDQASFTDVTSNWLILESLFFYFFYLSFAKVYTQLVPSSQHYYPKPSEVNDSVFLNRKGIIFFVLLASATLFVYAQLNFLIVFFLALAVIAIQRYVEWIRQNYSFLNVIQIRKEAIWSIKLFFIIHLLIFADFFFHGILSLLSLGNIALVANVRDFEFWLPKYIHAVKSVSYFFLVFFASLFFKSHFFKEEAEKMDDKLEALLATFFSQLNEKKLLLTSPTELLEEALNWFREKLGVDYVIIQSPDELREVMIVKNPYDEKLLAMPRRGDFPYLLEVFSDETLKDKTFFHNNLLSLDQNIREKFVSFLEPKNLLDDSLSTFAVANSIISMPIYSDDNLLKGRLTVVNSTNTEWKEHREMLFFAKFLAHLKVLLNYFKTYKFNYEAQTHLVQQKMMRQQMVEIKRLEEKYQSGETINKDKIEIQRSVLFEDKYPNNFFFIKEKKNELFVFANYFLSGVNRSLNIVNSLGLLNGLGEEFAKNDNAEKSLSTFLRKVNNVFSFFKNDETFVSSFVLNYEFKDKRLTFSNALHKPLLMYSSQKDEFWLCDINEGLPLGLKKGEEFKDSEMILSKNDMLFFLPDSTLDKNSQGETYDFNNLYRLLRSKIKSPLTLICEAIKNDLQKFFSKDYNNRIVILGIKILN